MEVHHHAGAHHGPKKFKDYFLEFMMIFLAVTMGFLAENVRQYFEDNSHVHQLAGQLKEDLINDTTNIQILIDIQREQIKKTDSIFALVTQPRESIDFIRLQQLIKSCDHIDIFFPSTGAMSTIKRELHLKEFVKTKVASRIDNYEKLITVLQALEARNIEYIGKYLESFMSAHFTPENAHLTVNRQPFANGNMRNLQPADLEQFSVDINLIKAYDMQLVSRYTTIKNSAVDFIKHVEEMYKLRD